MKYFKRYLSLLLVAVFLLVAFSVPTNAASTKDLKFTMAVSDCDSSYTVIREVGYSGTVTPDPEKNTVRVGQSFYGSDVKYAYARVKVFDSSNGVIMNSGNSYDFSFESVYYNNYLAVYKAPLVEFGLTFSDGTFVNLYEVPETSVSRGYFSSGSTASLWRINSKFKPEKDVTMITMRLYFDVAPIDPDYLEYVNYAIGYAFSGIELNEVTWLEGIISSIRNSLYSVFENGRNILDSLNILDFINNAITSVKDTISSIPGKITDIYNTVKDIPSNIVNFIGEKFNELFVPSSDDFLALYNDFYAFLDEKMPLITQIITLCQDFSVKFVYSNVMDVLVIPKIELPIHNETFVLGPYRVPVVPEGFEFLQTSSKLITSIVLVFLTVNFMISKIRQFLLEVQE